jgi:hypothetical protein
MAVPVPRPPAPPRLRPPLPGLRGRRHGQAGSYQGGFVVDGPRCATLEAWVDDAAAG